MITIAHILPWALLAAVVITGVELLAVAALHRRSAMASPVLVAVLVGFPMLAVLTFVIAISGFMFTDQVGWTAIACGLIAVTVIPAAVVMARTVTRRELQAQQRRAAEQAAESSRRELVAWLSHDLRTPLSGIRAMSEAIEDGMVDDEQDVRRFAHRIGQESERLSAMVDDLLEISRITSGSLQLRYDRQSTRELVARAIDVTAPAARRHRVAVRASEAEWPTVMASGPELLRALQNLLANGIRHTPAGGEVTVTARNEKSFVVLAVQDGCGGIPDAELERVFDTAFRGEQARSPQSDVLTGPGVGLGLAITRGLVQAHGGSVSVANRPPGCRFEIRLPASSPSADH